MPLVCPHCGAYALSNPDHRPDATRCAACETVTPANIPPLFVVTGASGSGKTTIIPALRPLLPDCIVFDKDLLWGRPESDQFTNNWLRIAYSVAQGGRYSVLCGTTMPWDVDACEDRTLVGPVHYLNLHCNDMVREERLRARPGWRGAGTDAFVDEHITFAHWLVDNAATAYTPPIVTVDTSDRPVADAAAEVAAWVQRILAEQVAPAPSGSAVGA
jgi:energy-coupling factor transporter ATP-binding protein EcfA2